MLALMTETDRPECSGGRSYVGVTGLKINIGIRNERGVSLAYLREGRMLPSPRLQREILCSPAVTASAESKARTCRQFRDLL